MHWSRNGTLTYKNSADSQWEEQGEKKENKKSKEV